MAYYALLTSLVSMLVGCWLESATRVRNVRSVGSAEEEWVLHLEDLPYILLWLLLYLGVFTPISLPQTCTLVMRMQEGRNEREGRGVLDGCSLLCRLYTSIWGHGDRRRDRELRKTVRHSIVCEQLMRKRLGWQLHALNTMLFAASLWKIWITVKSYIRWFILDTLSLKIYLDMFVKPREGEYTNVTLPEGTKYMSGSQPPKQLLQHPWNCSLTVLTVSQSIMIASSCKNTYFCI